MQKQNNLPATYIQLHNSIFVIPCSIFFLLSPGISGKLIMEALSSLKIFNSRIIILQPLQPLKMQTGLKNTQKRCERKNRIICQRLASNFIIRYSLFLVRYSFSFHLEYPRKTDHGVLVFCKDF